MRDVDFPERGQGYLDFDHVDPALREAATLWISDFMEVYEGGAQLPKPRVVETRLSLNWDPSFASYDQALAHVTGPKLTNETPIFWDQLMLDVLFEYPIQSTESRFSIHPALDRLAARVVIALRFLPPGGAIRAFEFLGDPGLVHLDPRWFQAAGQFGAGFPSHSGWDRPSALSVLPGDPVPALPRADPGGHGIHGGAFDHADRFGLQFARRMRYGFRR